MRSLILLLVSFSLVAASCGPLPSKYKPGESIVYTVPASGKQPQREYTVHLPGKFQNDRPHPIVFSFHGHKSSSQRQESISGLSASGLKIANSSFIAVYPAGVTGSDGGSAWQGAPYAKKGVDDVAFVQKIIDALSKDLCVDANRIYATGKSNGGGFTNYLACNPTTSKLFAAFSTVSAALYNPQAFNDGDCKPKNGTAVIDFHGTKDTVINYKGGTSHGASLPDIDAFRAQWAKREDCDTKPVVSYLPSTQDPKKTVTVSTWSRCSNGAQIVGWKVEGMQHTWPRASLPTVCPSKGSNDCATVSFDATPFILDFFGQFKN